MMKDSIITGIFAIIGAGVGSTLTYFFTRNSARKAVDLAFRKSIESFKRYEFIKAGNRFKTAFIDTKILLKDTYWYKPFETHLSERIPIERRAIDDFVIYLPESKRVEIEEAWQEYRRKSDDDFANEYFMTEEEIYANPKLEKERKKLIIDRIERIEKFADPIFVFGKD